MALIKCPDCGKMISDKSNVCIGCGRPMKNNKPYVDYSKIDTYDLLSERLVKESYDKYGWTPFLY